MKGLFVRGGNSVKRCPVLNVVFEELWVSQLTDVLLLLDRKHIVGHTRIRQILTCRTPHVTAHETAVLPSQLLN